MASSTLQISIQTLVNGLEQLEELRRRLRDTQDGAGEAGGGIEDLTSQTEAAAQSFNALVGYAKAAAAAFAAFIAVASLKASADIAARNETLGVTLGVIGQNAGYSKEQITKYEGELTKLGITTGSARDSLVQMMQAGLDLGDATEGATSTVGALARAAQDLAVVQGTSSSETFQGLIRNIQQLDTEGLRFQGIVLDLETAYESYAVSIGKSASALSQQEKQQAAANAVLEKAKGLTGAYEAALDTVGKKLGSLARYQDEANAAVGESLLPAYKVLVESATEFLKVVTDSAKAINENGKVAEILKNTLQSVLDVGGAIAKGILSIVQSIAPALEKTFDLMQGAFEGFDLGGVSDTFDNIVEAAGDLGVAIVEAVGEASPSIRLLADAFLMVFDSVSDAIAGITTFGSGLEEGASAGEILSVVLQSLGLLVAGFADGLSIVKAVGEIMFSGLMVGFGAVANVVGDIVGLVDENLGQAFKDVGDNAIEMGMKSAESAVKTFKAFSDGETYFQKYADKLAALPAAHEAEGKAAVKSQSEKSVAFAEAEEKVRKYTQQVLRGGLAGQAAADEYKKVVTELNAMGKEFGFSEKEMSKLAAQMETSKTKGTDLSEALKDLGLEAGEFATGVSQGASTAAAAFTVLADSGTKSADQLFEAFKQGLSMAKNLEDIELFRVGLQKAFDDGRIGADELGSGIQLLGGKFDELFEKQMKAASTKEDFRLLEGQVRALGESGTITGGQMQSALDKITQAATGAREGIQRLASQTTELAAASTRLAQADLAVTQAAMGVQTAKNDLLRAEATFRKDGTELAKQEVEVAKLGVQLAEQKSKLALLQRAQEIASMDVLIAKQQLLNAEVEAGLNIGDEAAARKVEAAKAEVESKALVLESAKQNVEAQTQNVINTEQASASAQQLAANMRDAANAAKDTADGSKEIDRSVRNTEGALVSIAALTQANVQAQLEAAGLMAAEAKVMADKLLNGRNMLVAWGVDGVTAFENVNAAVKGVKDSMDAAEVTADTIRDSFANIQENAEYASASVYGLGIRTRELGPGANLIAEAYREIAFQAAKAVKSAEDATQGFLNSTRSINEELLSAQGKDLEVSNSRFAARKMELEVQYELLKVQLEIARAQAEAAGISVKGIDESIAKAKTGFTEAKKNLDELQRLDKTRIDNAAAAAKKAEGDKKTSAIKEPKNPTTDQQKLEADNAILRQKLNDYASGKIATAAGLANSVPQPVGAGLQSIANAGSAAANAPNLSGAPVPSGKTTVVKFELNGRSVSATVDEKDESALINLLSQARKVS